MASQIQVSSPGYRGNRTAWIKSRAQALGFHKIGIVAADALGEAGARLKEWLDRGYHGEMNWMARDPAQRADPRRLFPEAKSVVVVAMNYFTPHQHEVGTPTGRGNGRASARTESERIEQDAECGSALTGKVSRYAWGDDYHEVVGDKLRTLLSVIKEEWPEADGKVCVDIQPTMDKAWAARAGLGWMGKHTNVITEDYGSWIFLGELLLNLELDYEDREVADQCGACTLCIDACPTGAIIEPYLLDSNRCISHATIESRSPEMRSDVAENLEEWLYGCDICQDVCPWNQMTPATGERRFEPRPGNVRAPLAEILQMTPETYAQRFRHSAIKRAKLAGLQRNARTLLQSSETK